ncbi:MAG: TusE/DsrC/DsvC family sulfur relay protein [Betaproteobacteria bacterium]|nr:TusE/DsrC/DsvC family sulfur relay protein [Betaproteobacteria bacterium]
MINANLPEVDAEGYLVDPGTWNASVAEAFAQQEHITLTDDHWDVIHFIRSYFDDHQVAPDARFVIKHLMQRLGPTARNTLFELFPYGYVKQTCRIAGMKRPRAWSTG